MQVFLLTIIVQKGNIKAPVLLSLFSFKLSFSKCLGVILIQYITPKPLSLNAPF